MSFHYHHDATFAEGVKVICPSGRRAKVLRARHDAGQVRVTVEYLDQQHLHRLERTVELPRALLRLA